MHRRPGDGERAPAKASLRGRCTAASGAVRGGLPLLAMLLAGCAGDAPDAARQAAVAALGDTLPMPYRDGLVVESARSEGRDVVLSIRFPEATVAMAEAKPMLFQALREDEQAAMRELCGLAVLEPVLATGGGVRRRFIDADGAPFFETRLAPDDCLSSPRSSQDPSP
ncbi:hypothetical protein [Stenotrophomonas mori]|uniref:Lipoprotein n=1 Tax=Stenotrophomonas mori TaxID=2871096 RepID=A0ABT0SGT7_9GAMM|nr:hypothetical protein [Stenotrophomonas mori]MCL7714528.1 hypothetical protein [Stenotrophomonas mori]